MNQIIPFSLALKSAAQGESADLSAAIGRVLDRGSLDQFGILADAIDRIGDALETAESRIKSLDAMFDAIAGSYRELDERLQRLEARKEE